MVDIRERVEEDRGLLKKLQLHIPGFSGYRKREDIRAADNILRIQLAERLGKVREGLEECRRTLVSNYETKNLEKIGNLINKFKGVEGRVRHAEQGYSGISATIRIEERELDKLYEYDYSMLTSIMDLESYIPILKSDTESGNNEKVSEGIKSITSKLNDFENTFKSRINKITGVEV
ncbi:MAG: hypothetical protein AB1779_11795 [Candidatus Thermoplasmatota archaeon]